MANKAKKYLSETNPKLAKQWHPTLNGELTPNDVTVGSNKKVWWTCEKGHEWETSVNMRTSGGTGCPFCSGQKVLKGFNDLATVNPEVAKRWHPTKNGDLTPDMVTHGSGKKVWWQCEKGHEWQARISSRTYNTGCPFCFGKQWHPALNGDLTPNSILFGTNQKIWWTCENNGITSDVIEFAEEFIDISERGIAEMQIDDLDCFKEKGGISV